jgi:DNA polymerase-3 subunit gamma/tau
VFTLVDRVVEAGHDPRRFVADLLDRLRDLVVLAAVPEVSETGLIDAPVDQLDRMRAQAARFSPAELSRAADLVNTGLTELRGATAPRLQLELICARVLLPGAGPISDHVEARDLHARLDRLERRLAGTAPLPATPPTPAPAPPPTPATSDSPGVLTPPRSDATQSAPPPAAPAAPPIPATSDSHGALTPPRSDATKASAPTAPAAPAAAPAAAAAAAAPVAGAPDIHTVRRMWPDVLNIVKTRRRFTWMILIDGVQVASVDDNTLVLAFAEEGKRKNFLSSGSDELLSGAIQEVLRVRWRLDAVLDPNRATTTTPPPAGPAHSVPAPAAPAAAAPAAAPTPPPAPRPAAPVVDASVDDSAHEDDEPLDDAGLTGRDLLIRELGASVLEEIEHDV